MNGIDLNVIEMPLEITLIADRMLTESLLADAVLLGLARARPNLQVVGTDMGNPPYDKISTVSGLRRKLLQALNRIGQLEMATICGISARRII